jgi:hypothetical protein
MCEASRSHAGNGIPSSEGPALTLLEVTGTLYFVSEADGNRRCRAHYDGKNGCGTVYAFTP